MNVPPVERTTSAIVTGSAQGIGAVEAEHLVSSGRFVVLNDIDADLLEETAQRLGGPGVAVAVVGDISLSETAGRLVAAATADGRRLDVVINNAGAIANGMIHTVTDEDFDHVVGVNLRGAYMLSREAAAYWRDLAEDTGETPRATLISTTSRAALLANPGQTNYGAPKAGVAVMTQILARELRGFGVRCNVIAPRAYTKMMRDGLGDFREDSLEEWSPKHIGRFVDFLCGPGGDDITGQIFVVHGPRVNLVRTWQVLDSVELDYEAGPAAVRRTIADAFVDDDLVISDFQADDFPLADPAAKNPFKVVDVVSSTAS